MLELEKAEVMIVEKGQEDEVMSGCRRRGPVGVGVVHFGRRYAADVQTVAAGSLEFV